MKILVIMGLVGLALLGLRSVLGQKKSDLPSTPPPRDDQSGRASRLLPCETCGALTPEQDVVWREAKPFCSKRHAGF